MHAIQYAGRADAPLPPHRGWTLVEYDDAAARELAAGALGELPPYHYADALTPSGLYRLFAWETPIGQAVSALRFVGLGASTLGDAQGDLSAFDATIAAGDTYLGGQEYDSAVQSYQAAGQTGATTLGPEIDAQTNGASQALTQQAWQINGQLAAIPSSSSSDQDATNAQALAHQMQSLYQQAIAMTPAPMPTPGTTPTPLDQAAQALVQRLAQGCPTTAFAECSAFQAAWNASGYGTPLKPDGKYGNATHDALQAVLDASGASAPDSCFGGSKPAPGGSTPEPVPQPDAGCGAWVADATNAQINAIAKSIVASGSPAAWVDQGHHDTTLPDGSRWRLVMWLENGARVVAAYRCTSPKAVQASMASNAGLLLAVLAVAGIVVTAFAAHKPVM